jgi:hypothetical protein
MAIFSRLFQLFLVLTLSGFMGASPAQAAQLIRSQWLLAAPNTYSAMLATLPAGAEVEVLERRGGWSRVRKDSHEGWLRVLALRETKPGGMFGLNLNALLNTDKARPSRVTGVAGIRGLPPERPSAHALILGIGAYRNGIAPLNGVIHDADSAALMARALGVPDENVTSLNDAALTLEGLRTALDGLAARVLPNDEVFLYFSGRGSRQWVIDGDTKRCAETLLSVDGEALLDSELEQRLKDISRKARRLVVFIDAGHTDDNPPVLKPNSGLSGKSHAAAQTCSGPVNALTRSLIVVDPAAESGKGKRNYLFIAAARAGQTALDDAQLGGLASQAWLDCLAGGALDLDGSAGISARELQTCAQPLIEQQVRGEGGGEIPLLTLIGNPDMVLASPEQLPAAVDPAAVLKDIHANRDDRRRVRLSADKPAYKVSQDLVRFKLESSHAGYVYLLMAGSDGKRFDLLFPNKKDPQNRIQAGETWDLPRSGWAFRASGPAGSNRLLAIVSDTPRDFSGIGMQPAGPFSVIGASAQAASEIHVASTRAALAAPLQCTANAAPRTTELALTCSDAYGADLISLIETD